MSQERLLLSNLLIRVPFSHCFHVPVTFVTSKSDLLAELGEFKDKLKTTIPCFIKWNN